MDFCGFRLPGTCLGQTELQRQQWRCAESEAALKAERGVLEVAIRGARLVRDGLEGRINQGGIQPCMVGTSKNLVNVNGFYISRL